MEPRFVRALVVASVAACLALVAGCGARSAAGRTNLATNLGGSQEVKEIGRAHV